jgi:hypothetical protein
LAGAGNSLVLSPIHSFKKILQPQGYFNAYPPILKKTQVFKMARFSVIYYLFAVVVVLAVVTNARPTTPNGNMNGVAGIPGIAAALPNTPTQGKMVNTDTTTNEDIAEALGSATVAVRISFM